MYTLLVFIPLFNAIICAFFSRITDKSLTLLISVGNMLLVTVYTLYLFGKLIVFNCIVEVKLFTWIDVSYLNVSWAFTFDNAAMTMILLVNFISTFVHIYSLEYMAKDPHIIRFMSYLSFFTFFMLLLVSANNLLQLFVGWEGVGLCSYLLINFWFTRVQANKSALKALTMNRIGDFSLVVGMVIIFTYFKSLNFTTILNTQLIEWVKIKSFQVGFLTVDPITLITLALFIGAVGKSAQIGLHTWLPDAMEGPTPVSALIHAATMVTAGVFLIIRCSALFVYSPITCNIMLIMGAITVVMAGTIGLVQYDIKKIIAYSTCSQLGYMILGCGLQQFSISFFHLVNHAFFKALLFLSAGAIIHALHDEQDIRKMGGLRNLLPFTYACTLIGSLALMGIPFLTGFYSKDTLLEVAYGSQMPLSYYAYWLGLVGAGLTSYYSTRLIYYVFLGTPNGFKSIYKTIHEPGVAITVTLLVLALNSIFFGYFFKDLFIGEGTDFFDTVIATSVVPTQYDIPFNIPTFYKFLPLFTSLSSGFLAYCIGAYHTKLTTFLQLQNISRLVYILFNKKWFFDSIYNRLGYKILNLGYVISYKFFDKGVLEYFGPLGVTKVVYNISQNLSKAHNGYITFTTQYFVFGFIIFYDIAMLVNIGIN